MGLPQAIHLGPSSIMYVKDCHFVSDRTATLLFTLGAVEMRVGNGPTVIKKIASHSGLNENNSGTGGIWIGIGHYGL